MNLYFRLLIILIATWFKPRLPAGKAACSLALRVMPNDLDINLHMNNGRYLTICDLTRIDFFIRTGLMRAMRKHKWMPLVAEHTMEYRKSLKLFESFTVSMELTHWDEKFFYMTHLFMQGEKLIAQGTSKGVIRSQTGVVEPELVIAAVKKLRGQGAFI
jgi:YbgC/YbaW family acyl-CoA thioester hydrolase